MLFNIKADPFELNNLLLTPSFALIKVSFNGIKNQYYFLVYICPISLLQRLLHTLQMNLMLET